MSKILITVIVASTNVKKLWSHINSLLQESPYATISTVIGHCPDLQQKDPMARTLQKELATPNVNVSSG